MTHVRRRAHELAGPRPRAKAIRPRLSATDVLTRNGATAEGALPAWYSEGDVAELLAELEALGHGRWRVEGEGAARRVVRS